MHAHPLHYVVTALRYNESRSSDDEANEPGVVVLAAVLAVMVLIFLK
jgi:hypothetical protein